MFVENRPLDEATVRKLPWGVGLSTELTNMRWDSYRKNMRVAIATICGSMVVAPLIPTIEYLVYDEVTATVSFLMYIPFFVAAMMVGHLIYVYKQRRQEFVVASEACSKALYSQLSAAGLKLYECGLDPANARLIDTYFKAARARQRRTPWWSLRGPDLQKFFTQEATATVRKIQNLPTN